MVFNLFRSKIIPGQLNHRKKNGLALPIIVCIVVVVMIFFMTVSFFSQNQQHFANIYSDSEKALSIADSMLQEIIWTIRSTSYPSKSRPGLQKLYRQLLDTPAGKEAAKVEIEYGPEIDRLLVGFGDVSPLSIKSTVYFSQFKALPSPPASKGMRQDPSEKSGLIKIQIRIEYGKAIKVLNRIHKVKVARIVHPVLSRFSVFIKSPPLQTMAADRINLLHQNIDTLYENPNHYYFRNSDKACAPIIVNNGKKINLSSKGAYNFSSNQIKVQELAEKNAPIFLGRSWRLGLAGGDNKSIYSERFLTRMAVYDIGFLVDEFSQKAEEEGFLMPKPSTTVENANMSLFGIDDEMVFKDDYITPLEETQAYKFYKHPRGNIPIKQLKGSSPFRLFGLVNSFSPTLVLGDVSRFYRKQVTFDCKIWGSRFDEIAMPFLDQTKFARLASPKNLSKYFSDSKTLRTFLGISHVFGIRADNLQDASFLWPSYRKFFSCDFINEHFLRGLDFVATNKESGRIGEYITANNGTVPMPKNGAVFKQIKSKKIINESKESSGRIEQMFLGQNVTVVAKNGKKLFQGNLNEISFYDDMLIRASMKFETAPAFFHRCAVTEKSGIKTLSLPGNVFIGRPKGNSNLIIKKPLKIERGGTIIVNGNVLISAKIETLSDEPLTIVARKKIIIATPNKIEASLLAVEGITKKNHINSFEVVGTFATDKIEFENLIAGSKPKYISYDEKVNELNDRVKEPFFPKRIILSDEFRQFYGKAKR
jgi:hypothetical protein